jgi:hypothetical protein
MSRRQGCHDFSSCYFMRFVVTRMRKLYRVTVKNIDIYDNRDNTRANDYVLITDTLAAYDILNKSKY